MTVRAQAEGDLRADIGPGEIAALMTLRIFVFPQESCADAVSPTMNIVLDGLRAR